MKKITKKSIKKHEYIDPVLYQLFRDVYPDEETCIQAVKDAMKVRNYSRGQELLDFGFDFNTDLFN